jgi:hypothetical protein
MPAFFVHLYLTMIEPVTFDIYEPDPKSFTVSRNLLAACLTVVVLLNAWISGDSGNLLSVPLALIWGLTIFYFLFSSFFLREPLEGHFDGEVEFTHLAIVYKGSPYYLSEITAIDFSFNDYYNQNNWWPLKSLNQRLSQGVNNYVEFTLFNEESYVIYFRCETDDHHRLLHPFIDECGRLNKTGLME